MLALIGMVVVVVMVFGGYMLAGGKLAIVLHSLPFEMMIIGGSAAGTFLIANGTEIVKGALGDIRRVVSRPAMEAGGLPGPALAHVPDRQAAQDQGRAGARAACGPADGEQPLLQVPDDPEGPFRARLHRRHAADDDDEHGRPVPGRGMHAAAAPQASCRAARARRRPADHGRRPAGAGHRGGRAGRHQDHGVDQRARWRCWGR